MNRIVLPSYRLAALAGVLIITSTARGVEVGIAEESPGEAYRIAAVATAPATALASGELRLVFDWTDARNHYYVKLKDEQAGFWRVVDGEEVPLGWSGTLRRGRPAERLELSLQRRDWSMALICNRAVAARAEDRTLPPGAVGHGFEGANIVLESFAVQPLDDLWFADDFMRTDDELGGWESLVGRWENNQQGSKSSRSANAFSFRSVGEVESLAVNGYDFWSDYIAQAAVRCDGDGAVGLAVGVVDPEHYFRLRWTSRNHPDGGTLKLQRVFGGTVTDLTPPLPGGFREGVWYKLQLALAGGRLLAWVDDTPLAEVAVQGMGEGRIGLWTEPGATDTAANSGALFDDVVVRSWPLFVDDFARRTEHRWAATGDWRLDSGPAGLAAGPPTGELLAGADDWADVTWSAEARATGGRLGLLVHRTSDGGYALRGDENRLELVKLGARPEVLDTVERPVVDGEWHALALSWDNGLLRAWLDHVPVLQAFDLGAPAGRCGLLTEGADGAEFDQVQARFRPTEWRIPPALPADFIVDSYMVTWASPGAAWVEVEGSPARWHKGVFFGDRTVSFQIPGFGEQTGTVDLILGAQETAGKGAVRLRLELAKEPALKITLYERDQAIAEATPEIESEQPAVKVELRGRYVLVWIDDVNVLRQAVGETT